MTNEFLSHLRRTHFFLTLVCTVLLILLFEITRAKGLTFKESFEVVRNIPYVVTRADSDPRRSRGRFHEEILEKHLENVYGEKLPLERIDIKENWVRFASWKSVLNIANSKDELARMGLSRGNRSSNNAPRYVNSLPNLIDSWNVLNSTAQVQFVKALGNNYLRFAMENKGEEFRMHRSRAAKSMIDDTVVIQENIIPRGIFIGESEDYSLYLESFENTLTRSSHAADYFIEVSDKLKNILYVYLGLSPSQDQVQYFDSWLKGLNEEYNAILMFNFNPQESTHDVWTLVPANIEFIEIQWLDMLADLYPNMPSGSEITSALNVLRAAENKYNNLPLHELNRFDLDSEFPNEFAMDTINAFGVTISGNLLVKWGVLLIALTQLYLYSHLVRAREINVLNIPFPWIVLYKSTPAKAISIITICLAPVASSAMYIFFREKNIEYNVYLATISASLSISIAFLTCNQIRAIWRTSTVSSPPNTEI